MAEKRVITSAIWQDEFFGSLDMVQRLLWVGLFSALADDQGRMIDNPIVIRSKVFPYDDMDVSVIEKALRLFVEEGKIIRYTANKKKYIQLINWWEHQQGQWAVPSKYPAPDGWNDRVRSYIKGTYYEINWPKKQARRTDDNDPAPVDTSPVSTTWTPQVDTPPGQATWTPQVAGHNPDPDPDPEINPDPDPKKKREEGAATSATPTGKPVFGLSSEDLADIVTPEDALLANQSPSKGPNPAALSPETFAVLVYREISGQISPPNQSLDLVIGTISRLRSEFKDATRLRSHLSSWWLWWRAQRSASGRPYSTTTPAWITEKAVTGDPPPDLPVPALPEESREEKMRRMAAQLGVSYP